MNIIKKYFGLVIVLFLSYWSIQPLFNPGFFPIHDDTQVARVYEMGKVLQEGIFPVRWVPDLGYGYGYPIFNFYAPLVYYVGGFLTLFGLNALVATKLMMAMGVMLSGITMYFLAREFWGEIGGIISALFYVYAPYHAVNIYVRGDVAEFWAYAFIPVVFYGMWMIYKKREWKYVVFGLIGYAGVILSHNLTALMVTPFLFIIILLNCYIAYKTKKLFIIHYSLFIILFGLLLSCFYWIPALLEMGYTNVLGQIGGGADFRDHFVCFSQLWESNWGFGGSTKTCIDGLSFKIGKLHILLSFAAIMLTALFIIREKSRTVWNDEKLYIIAFSFLGFITTIFLTIDISKSIWETIPFMAFFQYPWRFLLMIGFFSSLLAGSVIWIAQTITSKIKYSNIALYTTSSIVILLLLYSSVKIFQPQITLSKSSNDYTSDEALTWTTSKISDEYLPKNVELPKSYADIPKTNIKEKSVAVTVENQRVLFERYKNQLPPLRFEQTAIEKIANLLSLAGALLLIIGIIYRLHEKKR